MVRGIPRALWGCGWGGSFLVSEEFYRENTHLDKNSQEASCQFVMRAEFQVPTPIASTMFCGVVVIFDIGIR